MRGSVGVGNCPPGVDLNVHGQHYYSKLFEFFASLTGMTFDAITLITILLNELQNAFINRR